MKKKAIIFDLDNTIYPVESIGEKLFKELFKAIESSGEFAGDFIDIKLEIQRKPFQLVAKEFRFSDSLTAIGLELLSKLEYKDAIQPFDDYLLTKEINCLKFLVTTGFSNLQWSKVDQLNLRDDFRKIVVVDPSQSALTKKDVFAQLMKEYNLNSNDVLVVGDDIHSEIKAGIELGIDVVVYDYTTKLKTLSEYNVISHYSELDKFIIN